MRGCSLVRGLISRASCQRVLRHALFVLILLIAAGTTLSTSTAALATPLGPWLPNPPADVSPLGQHGTKAQIAVGPDGATTITWAVSNGSGSIVKAATRAAGASTFSTPRDVSAAGSLDDPQIAVGPDGTTTITWWRYSGSGGYMVQAATRAAGATTFSAPIDLSAPGGDANDPQVATGPDGTTTITWSRSDSSHFIVQAATRAAGATAFSAPSDLSASGQDAYHPQVATGPDGATTITWQRRDGSNWIVQAARHAAGATTFGTPSDLSATGHDANFPQVATGPDGTTTITWTRNNGTNDIVQATTRAANAIAFSTPDDLSAPLQNATSPQIGTGPDGTTTITWKRSNGSKYIVQTATRAANAIFFSMPDDLSAPLQNAYSPQVATGPDGTTTITWARSNGTNDIVQAATRAAGAPTFSAPSDLSAPLQTASSPQMTVGPDGTTTITWARSNGSNTIVQAVTATPPPSVLTITKTGNGTVSSTPTGINCGATCTATLANLTNVTLTATAATDSTFGGWNGDCAGASTCTVSMTQARNVTATFLIAIVTPTNTSATRTQLTAPTGVHWATGTRTTNHPITSSFTAAPNTAYTITATSDTARRFQTRATRAARGTCKITTNTKTKKRTATCAIRFKQAGTWLIAITPIQNGVAGTPATKTIKIQAATKKTRTLLARRD